MSAAPRETYPPLPVYADAPLTAAVTLELFQSCGRQSMQIDECFGTVYRYKPVPTLYLKFQGPSLGLNALEYGGGAVTGIWKMPG